MEKKTNIIVFTDLDGTLLEHNSYSFEPAINAINWLKKENIPIILVSSKTKKEMLYWQNRLKISEPFIVENGSAIFFKNNITQNNCFEPKLKRGNNDKIVLGKSFNDLLPIFKKIADKFSVKGFFQMTVKEIISLTGLSEEQAEMAINREYSIPFIIENVEKEKVINDLLKYTESFDASIFQGGRFFHLIGKTSKGEAIQRTVQFYKINCNWENIQTYALGDSPNDFSMLEVVHFPILVKKFNGEYSRIKKIKNVIHAEGIGPKGWQWAIENILQPNFNN